ncbi:MAG: substrate-binding domain-containing protein, partial [Bacteroidales bacterium]
MKKRRNNITRTYFIYILLLFAIVSCTTTPKNASKNETTTRGEIKIAIDDSYSLLFDTQLYTFHSLYKNATIHPIYASELDIYNLYMKDSVRLMVSSTKLAKEDEEYLRSLQIIARTTTVAYDAIAFITNTNNPDTLLTYNQVKKIFSGEITDWKQINKNNKSGKIKIVFDSPKSSNVRFIKEKLQLSTLPQNTFS